ncbi:SDR family NAD(P)-dependent oxidoreductase [Roseiflexus sp.]|uniref:SDR family NAD(P)-dependent oxidoreductase n=1 Tax=Roseiflexus sp. TaxID=2562120 RepID=UPI00398AD9AE
MSTLNEKTAFITGGGRGIGRAIALTFAGAGAAVAVAGRNRETLEDVCAIIEQRGGRAVAVLCDVADAMQVYTAISTARAALGPFDILVNNAGITYSAKLTDTDDALWERVIQVNLNGAYYCCKAIVPDMIARGGGRIINIASMASLVGMPFSAAYSAAKHGLLGLTRSLALELQRYHITSNAICPAWVDTDMMAEAINALAAKTGRTPEEAREALLSRGGQQRAMSPEEVAIAALRLAGPDGTATNGETIVLH